MRVLGQMVMGLALIGTHPAMSQSKDMDSGNAYLPHCRAASDDNYTKDALFEGRCLGIVSAMIGVSSILAPQYRYCVPDGANTGQALKVVIRYLDANPSQLHLDFRYLVHRAFKAAWPCK
jgi:Rap1a immunity proteins